MDPFTANQVASLLRKYGSYKLFTDLWPQWWFDPVEREARMELGGIACVLPRTAGDRIGTYFYIAAREGRLKLLKWLHREFLCAYKIPRMDRRLAFQCAARNGHLDILKWLHLVRPHSTKEAKSYECGAFNDAAKNGHLKVLKWIHQEFPHTMQDVKQNRCSVFCNALWNDQLHVLKWLHQEFPHSTEEIKRGAIWAFNGNMYDTALCGLSMQWVRRTFL